MTLRETELTEQLARCQLALAESRQENALLRQKIDLLVRRVFGASSETLDRSQLELLLSLSPTPALPSATELTVVSPGKQPVAVRQKRKNRWPENLPVVEEVIEPEPVKAQPEAWRCIGQEVSEQLDYEPARFLRRRTIRKKYVHRTDADRAPVIAALPERLQDRSLPAPGLLAQVLVSKYCDHTPLYRQSQIFARHGVDLPRSTLAGWVGGACWWLEALHERLKTCLPPTICLPTTRRSLCSIPVADVRRPDVSGFMPASNAAGVDRSRRLQSLCSRQTAELSVQLPIWRTSRACSMSTAMPASNP